MIYSSGRTPHDLLSSGSQAGEPSGEEPPEVWGSLDGHLPWETALREPSRLVRTGSGPNSHRGGHWFDPSIAHHVRGLWHLYQDRDGSHSCTVSTQREALEPLIDIIGAVPLRELSAPTVRSALKDLAATRATRTVSMTHAGLRRAIRHAETRGRLLAMAPAGCSRPRRSRLPPAR